MFILLLLLLVLAMFFINCSDFSNDVSDKYIISYDFDNTLKNQYTKEPVYPILKQMISDYKNKRKVIVCTLRKSEHLDDIYSFLKEHNMEDVPVIATNHQAKSKYLYPYSRKGYKIIHYDDQEWVLLDLLENIPKSTGYRVMYKDVTKDSNLNDVIIKY